MVICTRKREKKQEFKEAKNLGLELHHFLGDEVETDADAFRRLREQLVLQVDESDFDAGLSRDLFSRAENITMLMAHVIFRT